MKKLNICKNRTIWHNSFMPINCWYGHFEYTKDNTVRHIDYYISDFDAMTVNVWRYVNVPSRGLRWDSGHKAHRVTRHVKSWNWQTFDIMDMPPEFRKFIEGMVSRLNPHGVCAPWIEHGDAPVMRKVGAFVRK